jgi:hypothetical protein
MTSILQSRAMLVSLSISQLTGKRKDRKVTEEVASNYDVTEKAGNGFDEAAAAAARQFTFRPAMAGEAPVAKAGGHSQRGRDRADRPGLPALGWCRN